MAKNYKNQKIKEREITQEMRESYIDYAMSVIISRALPDVRDGLKPVQRRILYSMYEMGLKPEGRFRKSATVVGECFVKNTMVLTKKGLVPIQEVKVGDQVYTQDGLRRVNRLYEMPEKPLLKVILDNGLSNIVTPSQKFKVLTPDWKFVWKEAKDLTRNDYLVIKTDYPEVNNLVKLNKIKENQPQYLNKNIAYLLGFFLSDGSISKDYGKKKDSRIRFSSAISRKILERVAAIFEKEFSYKPTIEVKNYKLQTKDGRLLDKKKYIVRINRKAINEFFVSNFSLEGVKAPTKKIPYQIFQSPPKVIFSFISGLIDGDGYIASSSKENYIQYGSVSEKLIDQLLILLQHQGIFGSKYVRKKSPEHLINGRKVKHRHKPYSLEIYGKNAIKLAPHLELTIKRKQIRTQRIVANEKEGKVGRSRFEIIPYAGRLIFGELSRRHLGGGWYQETNGEKFRMGIKHRAGCKIRYSSDLWERPLRKTQVLDWGIKDKLERIESPLFKFLEQIIQNKIYFLKVVSIRKAPSQKTYDFEVENDHEFIANGMVSHNCMGKLHPHGDQAIYDALVRMAQDFSLRYPLVKGQGNFGSIDGDPPAHQRYSEAKLSKIGQTMLRDIEKDTVDFVDNYDATGKEPQVLPAPLPQLLLNGCLGIAVGMATNIPPHNLPEIIDATIHLMDHPKATTKDLFQYVEGPDFPGGGVVFNKKGMIATYSQGRGPIVMRGKAEIKKKGKKIQILITEIPFQVKKADLVREFAELVKEKRLSGVTDIRDESDKEGLRIVVDVSQKAFPKHILNRLYKFTRLQDTFYLNTVALVDGIQPRVLSLKEILRLFIKHRQVVVTRRARFDLKRAKDRAHILKGLEIALKNIDSVIKTIRKSTSAKEAEKNLIKKFKLTKLQAQAILAIRLSSLAKLERDKVRSELSAKEKEIKELSAILKSKEKIKEIIKNELKEIKENYGDKRRTKLFSYEIKEIPKEHWIPDKRTIITMTQGGYIKRISPTILKRQKRGGKGVLGMETVRNDIVTHFLAAKTLDSLLFFTNMGKVFRTLVYEIPKQKRVAKGKQIGILLNLPSTEKVLSLIPLRKEYEDLGINYLVMATKNGIIKKTPFKDFKNVRKTGLIAIKLRKNDLLRAVGESAGKEQILLATKAGQAIRFQEEDVRPMGRATAGVKGIRLKRGDEVIGMEIIKTESKGKKVKRGKKHLLVIMENGYGKRTDLREYKIQKRGGIGLKIANTTKKTGKIVAARVLISQKDLVVISQKGKVIRTKISSISIFGRNAQGVRIMKLDKGDKVASIAII